MAEFCNPATWRPGVWNYCGCRGFAPRVSVWVSVALDRLEWGRVGRETVTVQTTSMIRDELVLGPSPGKGCIPAGVTPAAPLVVGPFSICGSDAQATSKEPHDSRVD